MSNTFVIFINGERVKDGLSTAIGDLDRNHKIGGYDGSFFTGELDEVMIFNRALTEGEAKALFAYR